MANDEKKNGLTRRAFVKSTAAGLGGVALTGAVPRLASAKGKKITWRIQGAYPSSVEAGKFATLWAKSITELTGGELTVTYSEPGSIVPVSELFRSVSSGMVDATVYYGTSYRGVIPETDVEVGLPYAWENPTECHEAYYERGLIDELRAIYAEHNILFCCPAICNIFYGFHTTKPVRKPSDFKGMKMRDMGLSAKWLAHYGAAPTSIPAGEMYMALKTGTLDGVHYGIKVIQDMKLGEVVKYFIINPNPGTTVMNLLVSLKSFNALPDDIKNIVSEYSYPAILPVTTGWNEKGIMSSIMKEYNTEFVGWSQEDADESRAFMIEKLWPTVGKRSTRCQRLVDIVTKQAKDYGKI